MYKYIKWGKYPFRLCVLKTCVSVTMIKHLNIKKGLILLRTEKTLSLHLSGQKTMDSEVFFKGTLKQQVEFL